MCNKNKKGFSIGEVMVAAFILVFGIVSAVALSTKSTSSIIDSRNAAIASALSQEGVELVRNVRDNNVTEQICGSGSERCTAFDMNYGFPNTGGGEAICTIGYKIEGADVLLCGSVPDQLYVNTAKYVYTHAPGGADVSPFKRNVFISYDTTDNSGDVDKLIATVTSVVVWGGGVLPVTATSISNECKIGRHCAFAQTELTSWINYDD